MKDYLSNALRAAVIAIAALIGMAGDGADAQTVQSLPLYVNVNTVLDMGNGPLEFRTILGNAWMFTSQGSGVGSTSGSATLLTLTATPTTVPCVGCIISGSGITSATTVTAYSGVSITLSAAMTVAASTPVAWGAACPSYSSIGGLAPTPNIALQVGGSATDIPMYTQARICGISSNGPGATLLPFAIGAH